MLSTHTDDAVHQRAPARGETDEVELVRRTAAGDRLAFEVLYRCYYPRLRRFLEHMTRRPAMVEEILDDTLLVVWHRAHTYNLGSKVSTWIFAIAYHKALKALKRVDDAVEFNVEDDMRVAESDPLDGVMQGELKRFIGQAMSALSAEHRAVIELTYYQGYACPEIAQIMGCPVATVKTRMFYARRRLKALIAGNMECESWLRES